MLSVWSKGLMSLYIMAIVARFEEWLVNDMCEWSSRLFVKKANPGSFCGVFKGSQSVKKRDSGLCVVFWKGFIQGS